MSRKFAVAKASQPLCRVKAHLSVGSCVHDYVPLGRIGSSESAIAIMCPILDQLLNWEVVFMSVDVRYTGLVLVVVILSEIVSLQSIVVLQHIAYYNIIRLSAHYNDIQFTIA